LSLLIPVYNLQDLYVILYLLVEDGNTLRLVDGTRISGRLQVFSLSRGWTNVCWNNWTSANTRSLYAAYRSYLLLLFVTYFKLPPTTTSATTTVSNDS